METQTLYADFERESNDMFVITPEGNYFNFPASEYNELHAKVQIVDPKSHKVYNVAFDI